MKYVLRNFYVLFTAFVLVAACTMLAGCQKIESDGGAYRVRIPVDSGNGRYSLQTKELHTVTDLPSMAGSTAVFKTDGRFDIDLDDDGRALVVSSNFGNTPSAQFVKNDGVYFPTDYNSLSMTTAMYHFESIRHFYDEIGANKDLTFPRVVLINLTEAYHHGDEQMTSKNNAAYIPSLDLFFIDPYKRPEIPLALNGAVLTHEYFHSIFHKKIKAAHDDLEKRGLITKEQSRSMERLTSAVRLDEWRNAKSFDVFRFSDSRADETTLSRAEIRDANDLIFASLNEGVADFYAYEYSRNPAWIIPSLPSQTYRDLSQDKTFPMTATDQKRMIQKSINTHDPEDRIDEHGLGAYFAHFLYLVANGEWGHEKTRAETFDFLSRYAAEFVKFRDTKFVSVGELVKLYYKNTPPPQNTCRSVKRLFSGELTTTWGCGSERSDLGRPQEVRPR